METVNIVRDPGPWLQGGALGVLFAVVLVIVLCIVAPIVSMAVWAIKYLVTRLVEELRGLRCDVAENTAAMREVIIKQDILIAAIASPEPPRPSANGSAAPPTPAPDVGDP